MLFWLYLDWGVDSLFCVAVDSMLSSIRIGCTFYQQLWGIRASNQTNQQRTSQYVFPSSFFLSFLYFLSLLFIPLLFFFGFIINDNIDEEAADKIICKICLEREINTALLPCRHSCLCLGKDNLSSFVPFILYPH